MTLSFTTQNLKEIRKWIENFVLLISANKIHFLHNNFWYSCYISNINWERKENSCLWYMEPKPDDTLLQNRKSHLAFSFYISRNFRVSNSICSLVIIFLVFFLQYFCVVVFEKLKYEIKTENMLSMQLSQTSRLNLLNLD